ncbi:MAG: disulfide bond formation protein B [Saccharospirillum sp.]|nr:disulfide bond formation protein B [Saccharospirillum sp.]
MTKLKRLNDWLMTPWYWLAVIVVGVVLIAVALFYQHVLDEPPCVLCIHARIWTLAGVLAALVGIVVRRLWLGRVLAQVAVVISVAGLLERSYRTLQVERGIYEGLCGFDAGFPGWLPLDQWFPNLFEVWTMCGYSPPFLFGMTMVEGLTYGTVVLLAVAIATLVVMMINRPNRHG